MHANSDTGTLLNIPTTSSKLNDIDVITCYLYTFPMFFNSKDGLFFTLSICVTYAWKKIHFVLKYC